MNNSKPTKDNCARRFRPYPQYKDCRIEWLRKIPDHWQTNRFKVLARLMYGDSLPEENRKSGETAVYGSNGPVGTHSDANTCGPALVVGRKGSYGKINYSDVPVFAIDTTYFIDQTCSTAHLRWLYYAVQLLALDSYSEDSAVPGLAREFVYTRQLPVPSKLDQRLIASFLDRETAKLDALVAKKERLIELLQEKRTALITHAVTKGLDPNVQMKDSGIEWIGEIPAHWNVAPLYTRYEVALGKMLDSKRISGNALGPYIRNVDVQWDRIAVDNLPEMDFAPHERQRFCLMLGDLLVCEGGEVGRTAMWKGELDQCYYQKAVHRLRPLTGKEVPRFFYWVMFANAKAGRFSAQGNPNTIDHLTAVQLKRYRFAFPPAKEQATIARHLDSETAGIDALTLKTRQAISLLKEYRIALISAAVTGKIDVRA